MRIPYIVKRLGLFLVVVVLAASVNFIIPRLAPGNPIGAMIEQLTSRGQSVSGVKDIIAAYAARFGLDQPLWRQYLNYLYDTVLRFDLGYSISFFPAKVEKVLFDALPWTIGLLSVATLFAFGLGSLLGALMAWPRSPRFVKQLGPLLMPLSAVPYYLLALILIYLLAFVAKLFPLGGAYNPSMPPSWNLASAVDIVWHGTLPALSIVLAGMGFWALGMRGMMVTVQGEDYLLLAEAKGLPARRIFFAYAMRNAILPQVTALAIALGTVVSGSILVEVVFTYPGVGWLLYNALRTSDYFLVQGVAYFLVLTVALAVLIVDLIYPWLDPRITR